MCMRHTHTHRDMEVDIDTYRYLLTAIICLCNIFNPITNEQLGMLGCVHYDDVIMTMLASQISSLPVVCSIVYSDVNQRKHQSSASLAFVREIHRGPVNFPHKWPVMRKMFPFDDVIMSLVATHDLVLKNRPSVSTMLTKYWLFWTSFYTDMLQLKGAILEDKNIFWIKITQFINSLRPLPSLLTHWGPVTHICISKQTIIGSDNGLSPGCRRAIIWTNAGIL